MKKSKMFSFILLAFCCTFGLLGCSNSTENKPDEKPEEETPIAEERVLEAKELEVNHNNHDVIYLGSTFTAEGYDVYIVYRDTKTGETEKVLCDNYAIDDRYVDYEKIGNYTVTFTARVKSKVLKRAVIIRIADNRLIEAGIENLLYGIKAGEYTGNNLKVGTTDFSEVVTSVYLIRTTGKYDETGELELTETRKRSGYIINYDYVDTSTPGQYPVYVSFSEDYTIDGEKVTVEVVTFFIVTVEE